MSADQLDILCENDLSTVVAKYERTPHSLDEGYQSEAALERSLISQLQRQGYTYLEIKDADALKANLRKELERLNSLCFTDKEWDDFFTNEIARTNDTVADKARTIQEDYVKVLHREDGTQVNIYLLDKKDIHHNSTAVINQYEAPNGIRPCRYDVTILVNGLPLVHIELKRRGISLKEAFNQIGRYGRDSFWSGNGLFDYVQIFVISNGTQTKYYGNTTRESHIREATPPKGGKPRSQTCNSFEFTSYWADAENNPISELEDFTATFLSRHSLLSILTRFCVFTSQGILMVMRPYQIAATERLLSKIERAHNAKTYGSTASGGYIWHTTGSGKTLTSFKAAQLATRLKYIDKVLFVVDRKDLDYQTMKEYDRFQKGAANSNTSTAELKRQLENPAAKIIITTIQKLSCFVSKNPSHEIYSKEVAIIFDECHRSQFGQMHASITRRFKKYYIFGFTGTPIFAENIVPGKGLLRTTDDLFGERIHTYTIVDAIRDHNVLPFRVAYIRSIREKEEMEDEKVWNIDREKALADPRRIRQIAQYILDNFDLQTKRSSHYNFNRLQDVAGVVSGKVPEARAQARLSGFNSIFAVQSIDFAKLYYEAFKRLQEPLPPDKRLKIAVIFSYAANEELDSSLPDDENSDSTAGLDKSSRDFLDGAIADYNALFQTSYDTSGDKFPNYYKDVSQRMKNRELDLLIVVNMFLTGFDATTLNTLWVDKNLRYHGLIQAFSRTNRILNSVKVAGNIVCFRNLEDATNKALGLFGDREARSTAILRPFEDYFYGYIDEQGKRVSGYRDLVDDLREGFTAGVEPKGEGLQKKFLATFGSVLRASNLLANFEQFAALDPLGERERQDYTSVYISLAEELRKTKEYEKTDISDDIEFEMELVKQVEVNIDFILSLVSQYHEGHCQNAELRLKITKSIDSSPDLRDKKELIMEFVDSLNPSSPIDEEWTEYVDRCKKAELESLIEREHLRAEPTREFVASSFSKGYINEVGTDIDGILPPLNPFAPEQGREGKKAHILDLLKAFFNKYYEIASAEF